MRRYHLVAMMVGVAVGLIGCGASSAGPEGAPPAPMTQPQARASVAASPQTSSSASQSFLQGYRAYQNHDLAAAIDRLGYASEHFPQLGDYALYYRGLAQRDSGDLTDAATTFENLIHNYSESVTIAPAEVALSDVYLRLTHATDAAAAAS